MISELACNPDDGALLAFYRSEFISQRCDHHRTNVAGISSIDQRGIRIETHSLAHSIYLESAWHDNSIWFSHHSDGQEVDRVLLGSLVGTLIECGVTAVDLKMKICGNTMWFEVADLKQLFFLLSDRSFRRQLRDWVQQEDRRVRSTRRCHQAA